MPIPSTNIPSPPRAHPARKHLSTAKTTRKHRGGTFPPGPAPSDQNGSSSPKNHIKVNFVKFVSSADFNNTVNFVDFVVSPLAVSATLLSRFPGLTFSIGRDDSSKRREPCTPHRKNAKRISPNTFSTFGNWKTCCVHYNSVPKQSTQSSSSHSNSPKSRNRSFSYGTWTS